MFLFQSSYIISLMRPENRYQMMHFDDTVKEKKMHIHDLSKFTIHNEKIWDYRITSKWRVKLRLLKLKTSLLWLSAHEPGWIHFVTLTSSTYPESLEMPETHDEVYGQIMLHICITWHLYTYLLKCLHNGYGGNYRGEKDDGQFHNQ